MSTQNFLVLPLLVFLFQIGQSPARCQEKELNALTEATPEIPEALESGAPRLVISHENAPSFKNVILSELFPYVKNGSFYMPSVKSLHYNWRLDDQWETAASQADSNASINEDFLKEKVSLGRSYPFGRADAIDRISDPKIAAAKLIWNIHANFWGQKALSANWIVHAIRRGQAEVKLRAEYLRVYPLSLDPEIKTPQLFRELLRFKSPPAASALSYLYFRFIGSEEDAFWVYSPAISKTRQLTGSDRTSPIATLVMSFDDLFGWSGKPEFVDAEILGDQVLLVPFPELVRRVLSRNSLDEKGNNCYSIENGNDNSVKGFVEWNFESKRFSGAAWTPSSAIYIPRKVWKVELTPRDPYSLYGREILYVDKEMMLPLYKLVYDRTGNLWKIVIASFGLVETQGHISPYNAFLIVYDVKDDSAALLGATSISYCDQLPKSISLSYFDPSRLGPGN